MPTFLSEQSPLRFVESIIMGINEEYMTQHEHGGNVEMYRIR